MIDGLATPLALLIACGNQAEMHLIEPLIGKRALGKKPAGLIYDMADGSDPWRTKLAT